jgi:hypothetical protein
MSFRRVLAATTIACVAALAVPAAAWADTANTPVGQLTATQTGCYDVGATVVVSVVGGFANTAYTARSESILHPSGTFTTNAAGSGSTGFGNVSGSSWVTVTAAGRTGQVWVTIDCPGGKGE